MTKKIVRNQLSTNKNQTRMDIQRLFGDLPVVEGTADLRLFIKECDVTSASPKDPSNCVFAQACKRQFAAGFVMFYKGIAYIALPQEDSTIAIERFVIPSAMEKLIVNFDKGLPIDNLAGFLLKAPTKSQTLAGSIVRNRKNAAKKRELKKHRPASIVGLVNSRTSGPQAKARVIDLDVRNGSGMVHFIKRLSKKVKHNKAAAHAD